LDVNDKSGADAGGAEEDRINGLIQSINLTMRRKLSLLYEIFNHSNLAFGYVSEDSVEQLANVFSEKQEMIYEIDYLDRKFLNEFEGLKAAVGISSMEELRVGDNGRLADLRLNTSEIMDILKKIDALDQKVNQKIAKLREDVAADLVRIRRQRHISGIYGSDGAAGPAGSSRPGAYAPPPVRRSAYDAKK
jgi:hypothetical protein